MKAKMEQFPATNPNPMLNVANDGVIISSNEAVNPLLVEWGVEVGGKLPSSIGDIVQKVISRNSPEKIEVKVGNGLFLVVFAPFPEKECVNIFGFDISDQKKLGEKVQEREVQRIVDVELAEIIDAQAIQSLMDDFYKLSHIPMSLDDLKGNVLVGVGWQDICTKFHRINPETCKHCVESDTKLSAGVPPGKFKLYKCKNNMWDIATPIFVCDRHVGNIFSGQFFFDSEPLDYELFRSQARKYNFNDKEYIAALEKVPRLSRKAVDTGMSFFIKLANLISQLSYSNIKLAKLLSERDTLLETLRVSEEKYRNIIETANEGVILVDSEARTTYANDKMAEMLGYSLEEMLGKSIFEFTNEEGEDILKINLDQRRQGLHQVYELRLIRNDGSPLFTLVSAKACFNKDGKFIGSLGMITDITERKKAEVKLKETLDNLEDLVEERTSQLEIAFSSLKEKERILAEAQKIAHIGSWDWNLIADKMYWSDEMYCIFGRTPQKLSSYSEILSCIHPDDREHVDNAVKRALKGESFAVDHRLVLANGEERTVHAQGDIVYDAKNTSVRMRGTVQDITELRNYEEETRNLASIVESSNDAIGTISLDGNISSWNKGAEQVYGYSDIDILGKPVSILAPPHLGEETGKFSELVKQSGMPQKYETLRLGKDGKLVDVSITLSPVYDSYGKITAISFISRDISERKNAEEKLRESEEKYRIIVETANDGIVKTDNESIINYVNKKMLDMLGYSLEEAIDKPIWDFISDEYKPIIKLNLEKKKQGLNESDDLKLISKDGSHLWVHMNSKPIFDKQGKYMGAVSMLTDLTKRKEAEEALAHIEIARQKEIHHRIKNNLQVISSLLDLQADKFRNRKNITDSEVLEAFKESQDRVLSIALIHEELHKGEGDNKLNFSQYIEELSENLFHTYSLGKENIVLTLNLEGNVFFDMDAVVPLGMIVNELVSNSFKHAFSGRNDGEIQIKLHTEKNEGYLKSVTEICESTSFTLSISDNGVGIPDNLDIENLDSLGLQLVVSLVDQLDGKLELKRNNGTEFAIRFTVTER
jgi:PAS domain S-box-containing protein